jgi:arylsulfatase A
MKTKDILINSVSLSLLATGLSCDSESKVPQEETETGKPNVVIFFLDDAGWADFAPFGQNVYETPHVQQLAEEGCQFHNFYVPQAICSASRAALLTGCYPGRTKIFGALAPKKYGLDTNYATMGEVMQKNGYKTAIFGKWHLGDHPDTRAHNRGFDETSGLMYSNDMWAFHPENPEYWGQYPLHYWENGTIKIDSVTPKEQEFLTTWATEDAVDFINRQKDQPFFLYVPYSMPHVPLFCSDKFRGKSEAGLYGDVMMEIDWSVGQIMKVLKDKGLEENTLVIFSSDNGPWISYGNRSGKTPYREAKGTSFDGGVRSPCIIKYPGHIKENTVSLNTFFSIDVLPTICKLTGTDLPDNEIDGKDVWDLIVNKEGAKNPHDYYAFTNGRDFQGVITGDGKWKLHVPHHYRALRFSGKDGIPGKYRQDSIGYALFDMVLDPYEKGNLFDVYPEIAEKLNNYAKAHEEKFFDAK